VLVVEDAPVLRSVVARNLASRGCAVREAGTVAEALALLRAETPDLLLLDINLPDRTGWDVLRELTAMGKQVPTVILSAVRVSPAKLAEFQPVAYLPKPFLIEALLRLLETNGPADAEPEGAS
jgi:DNA-binding response OmpR family regulator